MMTETPIKICGRELYFKRCPNNTIKIYDEKIQEKAKTIEPLQREIEQLQEDVTQIEKKLQNTERIVELINRKEDPSDEDIDKANQLIEEQDTLYARLKKARQAVMDYNEEQNDAFTKMDEELLEIMGEKVEAMLDGITKEEFIENHDPIDIRIATYLSKYYELCIIGEKPKRIQEEIKKDTRTSKGINETFQ